MSDIRIIGNVIKGEQQHDGERVKKKQIKKVNLKEKKLKEEIQLIWLKEMYSYLLFGLLRT